MTDLEQLRAELATLRALVVGGADLAELGRVLGEADAAFGARRWTVAHLVDLGVVDAADARHAGRLLARLPFVEVAGRRLVPAGEVARGRAWRVVQAPGNSLSGVEAAP